MISSAKSTTQASALPSISSSEPVNKPCIFCGNVGNKKELKRAATLGLDRKVSPHEAGFQRFILNLLWSWCNPTHAEIVATNAPWWIRYWSANPRTWEIPGCNIKWAANNIQLCETQIQETCQCSTSHKREGNTCFALSGHEAASSNWKCTFASSHASVRNMCVIWPAKALRTDIANSLINHWEQIGVVVPSQAVKNVFTTGGFDNIDGNNSNISPPWNRHEYSVALLFRQPTNWESHWHSWSSWDGEEACEIIAGWLHHHGSGCFTTKWWGLVCSCFEYQPSSSASLLSSDQGY